MWVVKSGKERKKYCEKPESGKDQSQRKSGVGD